MTTGLEINVRFAEPLPSGARLAELVSAVTQAGGADPEGWRVLEPYSSALRTRLGRARHAEGVPYGEPITAGRLRGILEARPDDVDAVSTDALTPVFLLGSASKPEVAQIDLRDSGLQLFEDPEGHPATARERARLDAAIEAAEAAHEHWLLDDLKAARKDVPGGVRAMALDWFFALIEAVATRAGVAAVHAGPDVPRLSPVTSRMAWYPSVEAYRDALARDRRASGRYSRVTEKALQRDGDHCLELAGGVLLTNPDLDPSGPALEAWLESLR